MYFGLGNKIQPRLAISLLAACFLVGCTFNGSSPPVPSKLPQPKVSPVLPGYEESVPPLKVDVVAEEYDGTTLLVNVRLSVRKAIPAKSVKVMLSGKNNGEVIKQVSATPRPSGGDEFLRPGTPLLLPLELAVSDVTDYVVDVEWGPVSVGSESAPSLIVGQFANVNSNCREELCQAKYVVSAKLENSSDRILSEVTVGTSFGLRGDEGDGKAAPESEDNLQLPNLNIPPGGSQDIEITLDQEVPRKILHKLEPKLRLIAFNYR